MGRTHPPMQFVMPEPYLPASAEVAVLIGLHQQLGGVYKIVYVFRRLRCVHIYECCSHGESSLDPCMLPVTLLRSCLRLS